MVSRDLSIFPLRCSHRPAVARDQHQAMHRHPTTKRVFDERRYDRDSSWVRMVPFKTLDISIVMRATELYKHVEAIDRTLTMFLQLERYRY
jgi:hypothetical protein